MQMNRRDFVTSGLIGAATFCSLPGLQVSKADDKGDQIPVIDAHTHFYDPSRPEGIPWPSKGDALLYRTVLPAEFKQLTKPFGVTGTVIIEASSWVEDNQWLLNLAAADPFVAGIVGNLAPGEAGFDKLLDRFSKNPLYRGIRISSEAVKKGLERPNRRKTASGRVGERPQNLCHAWSRLPQGFRLNGRGTNSREEAPRGYGLLPPDPGSGLGCVRRRPIDLWQ